MKDTKNYFLASVGSVEAFRYDEAGNLELAFVSKTMTDTGLNDSVTADDIRAGQGAPVVARFYHDRTVAITLTDVMFKRDYLTAQLGADFDENNPDRDHDAYYVEPEAITASGTTVTLTYAPKVMPGLKCSDAAEVTAVWLTEAGKEEWFLATQVNDNVVTDALNIKDGKQYCARYFTEMDNAYVAHVMTDLVPQELHLIIHVPLYAGDACAASGGKLAGEVQFDIPRFRLDGNLDFAAAMSSNQTMSLSGAAMAMPGCGSAELYTIRIIYSQLSYLDEFKEIEALDSSLYDGEEPVVYGIRADKSAARIPNSALTFTPASAVSGGVFDTTSDVTISVTGHSQISSITVRVKQPGE